jgi:UDP-N-acetylmuramyl pentapeptide phosphotransferase/UDP-N-acetylglucosamine-1-phosphate transferase
MLDVWPLIAAFAAALLLGWSMRRAGIIDRPNRRSNHDRPTPRGGGLGVLAGFFIALAMMTEQAPASGAMLAGLALCGGIAGLTGLLDDLFTLPEALKFIILAAVSLVLAGMAGPVTILAVSLPWIVGLLGSALWVFTTANAVNFMDGSDGLIAACLIPACLVLALAGGGDVAFASLALAAALAGFAVWNAPLVRARGTLFAGDAGALGASVLFAGLALRWAATGPDGTAWLAALLILPLLGDVLLTMAARAKAKRRLFAPHRAHAYQLLIRTGLSHGRVALIWAGLSLVCGALALIGAAGPAGLKLAVFAIGVAGFAVFHRMVRKRAAAAGEDITQ